MTLVQKNSSAQKINDEIRVFGSRPYQRIYSNTTYETVISFFADYLKSTAFAGADAGCTAAEIGCGNADFGAQLCAKLQIPSIAGFDVSPFLLRSIPYPVVRPVVADVLHLPILNQSLNLVVAAAVLHHFPTLEDLLVELVRASAPKGALLIFEPNRDSLKERVTYRLGRFFSPTVFTRNEFPTSPLKMAAALQKHGYSRISWRPVPVEYRVPGKKIWVGRLLELVDRLSPRNHARFPFYIMGARLAL